MQVLVGISLSIDWRSDSEETEAVDRSIGWYGMVGLLFVVGAVVVGAVRFLVSAVAAA